MIQATNDELKTVPDHKVFQFDPDEFTALYRQNGYVHMPGGVSPEFLDYAIQFTENKLRVGRNGELDDWQFQGKKQQFLFDFDENSDYPEGVYETVATVTGLQANRIMLGERHLKLYASNAPVSPPPHKDRLASQVTLGIALKVPDDSRLILYPENELTVNPYMSSKEWRDSLDDNELPEKRLDGVRPVEIDMRPGDVVMFAGNSIYHERTNPSNTWVLYLKFNGERLDPLAEDPQTTPQRERSLELISNHSDAGLLDLAIEVSPRLEKVTRLYTRLNWQEVVMASILSEKSFRLSEDEFRLLRVINDRIMPVRNALLNMGCAPMLVEEFVPMVRRLATLGALDVHAISC